MKNSLTMQEKTLKNAGIIIIIILVLTTTIAFVSNSRNKRNYNAEKRQNEFVSSQKLQVSQDLDKVKSELSALTTKNESDIKELAKSNSKLTETERRIALLSKENSSLNNDKNELMQLQKSKSDLDRAYADLELIQETATSRIKELENSEILLEAQKKELSDNLINAEKYRTSNTELYGSRGNRKDKLTFIARRTKKLNLIFDVPQSLSEPITFSITTPDGKTIIPDNKTLTSSIKQDSNYLTASLSSIPPSTPGKLYPSQKVTMVYTPKEKFGAGIYKIQILSNGKNIGNCRLKLR
jgi:myosin heavy subunit